MKYSHKNIAERTKRENTLMKCNFREFIIYDVELRLYIIYISFIHCNIYVFNGYTFYSL